MLLMLYDMEAKKDPHGIRIRLVRKLRQNGAFQLQRSAWLLDEMNSDLIRITEEFRSAGGVVKLVEWLPRTMAEAASSAVRTNAIALVIMGAELIAEGWHEKIKKVLLGFGARVAIQPAGESAFHELIKRTGNRVGPFHIEDKSISRVLDEVSLMDVDAIVLLNSGRSAQSGIIFGAQAIANTKFMKNMTSLPLVQVERPGKNDGVLVVWNDSGRRLGNRISEKLGMSTITPNIEAKIITKDGGREVRQIHFAKMGDAIIVDGHKVGVCLTDQVYLVAENGRLVDIMGGKIDRKAAGKLRFESLSKVVVKSVNRVW